MIVKLTSEEVAHVKGIARARNDFHARQGTENQRVKEDRDDYTTNVMGVAAEFAVAKALGGEIDEDAVGGDPPDVTLPNGETVEVKFGRERGYHFALMSDSPETFTDDYGVLTCPAEPKNTIELVGWTSPSHLRRVGGTADFGYGERAIVEFEDLLPVSDLIDRLFFTYPTAEAQALFPPENSPELPFN